MLHPHNTVVTPPHLTPAEAEREQRIADERLRYAQDHEALVKQQQREQAQRKHQLEVEKIGADYQRTSDAVSFERWKSDKAQAAQDAAERAEKAAAYAKRLAQLTLAEQAAELADERGLDLKSSPPLASGWAEGAFGMGVTRALMAAKQQLERVAEHFARIRELRGKLGVGAVSVQELALERDNLEVAEARFQVAYERLDALRAQAVDPGFQAQLAECSALHDSGALDHWLSNDVPEKAELERATASIMAAVGSLLAKHQERATLRSEFNVLVRKLGLPPDATGVDPLHHAVTMSINSVETWVRDTIAAVARDELRKHGGRPERALDWFPREAPPVPFLAR